MNPLSPKIIEADDYGYIGAGKVVDFLPQDKRWIVIEEKEQFRNFITYTVSGNSLIERGIRNGDVLICRTRFELSEIKKDTVCVLLILTTGELMAKMIQCNPNGTVTVKSGNVRYANQVYSADEIEIKAIVTDLQRKL